MCMNCVLLPGTCTIHCTGIHESARPSAVGCECRFGIPERQYSNVRARAPRGDLLHVALCRSSRARAHARFRRYRHVVMAHGAHTRAPDGTKWLFAQVADWNSQGKCGVLGGRDAVVRLTAAAVGKRDDGTISSPLLRHEMLTVAQNGIGWSDSDTLRESW
eukprot:COSAG02_NODE_2008_length_10124_cov_83.805287_6_plen_161_part_00